MPRTHHLISPWAQVSSTSLCQFPAAIRLRLTVFPSCTRSCFPPPPSSLPLTPPQARCRGGGSEQALGSTGWGWGAESYCAFGEGAGAAGKMDIYIEAGIRLHLLNCLPVTQNNPQVISTQGGGIKDEKQLSILVVLCSALTSRPVL